MGRIDFKKHIFRLNLIVTGAVFLLLSPTVHVYQSWFPDKKNSLWMISLGVLLGSAAVWVLASLSMPFLIRQGWVQDLRKNDRSAEFTPMGRFLRILSPVLVTAFHLILILFFSMQIIHFLRQEPFEKLFTNLP